MSKVIIPIDKREELVKLQHYNNLLEIFLKDVALKEIPIDAGDKLDQKLMYEVAYRAVELTKHFIENVNMVKGHPDLKGGSGEQ